MFAALKKYWVTARLCARQMSYFGLADLMGGYLLRLAQMAVMLMVWSALFRQGADMQGMTLNQMLRYTLLSSALQPLLDVRTPEEYRDGHLPGAKNLPLDRLDTIAEPSGSPLFVYCRSGARSAQAKARLARAGYSVTDLGGLLGYRGPLEA